MSKTDTKRYKRLARIQQRKTYRELREVMRVRGVLLLPQIGAKCLCVGRKDKRELYYGGVDTFNKAYFYVTKEKALRAYEEHEEAKKTPRGRYKHEGIYYEVFTPSDIHS